MIFGANKKNGFFRRAALGILTLVLSGLAIIPAYAANLPPNFVVETYASGMDRPLEMSWSTDGKLYVAEKRGKIWVIENGVRLAAPFIDIGVEVNGHADRGSLGMTLHPEFPITPWVYFLHTYDPPETIGGSGSLGHNGGGQRVARMIRVTADAATNYNTAVPGSKVVLLGTNSTWANIGDPSAEQDDLTAPWSCGNDGAYVQDCIPNDGISHAVGTLAFGTDGMLYVSIGDAGTWTTVDARATRPIRLDSLAGKILRIDPVTGEGLSSNPYWDGNPDSNRSKVWQLGFRNPYRFAIDPLTGEVWSGDVGWTRWEELNHAPPSIPGANFGWPCYEGGSSVSLQQGGYSALAACQDFYANGNPVAAPYAYSHVSGIGGAIIVGDFYDHTAWPAEYRGALFFGDYSFDEINYAHVDGNTVDVHTFATDIFSVDISVGPDGNLYLAKLAAGTIERIVFGGPTIPPITGFSASYAAGTPATGWSYWWNATSSLGDPAGYQPLLWDGSTVYDSDGIIGLPDASAMANGRIGAALMHPGKGVDDGQTTDRFAIAEHSVADGGYYSITNSLITHTGCASSDGVEVSILADNVVVFTDEVGRGETDSFDYDLDYLEAGAKIAVALGPSGNDVCDDSTIDWDITFVAGAPPVGSPPTATITTPTILDIWAVHDPVNYTGVATDPDDGPLTGAALSWEVILHHNTHEHVDYYNAIGPSGSFPFPDHGDNTFAELCLTATDSDGRTDTDCVVVVPQTVTYTFDTIPSGLELVYTAEIYTTPFTITDLPVGSVRLISAPALQGQFQFDNWSIGGGATQQLTIGNAPGSLVASYTDLGGIPQNTSVRVSAGNDDAEEAANGAVDLTSSDLELVDALSNQLVGIRFAELALDPDVQIVDAYIQFTTDEVTTGLTSLQIRGDATENAPTFTTGVNNISSRPLTAASVPWVPSAWGVVGAATDFQRTPSLAAIVSEIIHGGSWTNGDALAFVISGSGVRTAESFNGVPGSAPLLYVSYLEGGGGSNEVPMVQISAPINGASFEQGAAVSFAGTAMDTEDGNLLASLDWVSNVDGFLGTGSPLVTSTLSVGSHTVEARSLDSGGLTGTDSININIDPPTGLQSIDVRVLAGTDDAEEAPDGSVSTSSSDLELVDTQVVGLRFEGVTVEPGTTVSEAYIQFTVDEATSGVISLAIQGEMDADAETFSDIPFDVSARPRTAASVAWAPAAWNIVGEAGALQRTPNIASVINEVISGDAWSNGNALAIVITGSGKRVAEAFNGVPGAAPQLQISFATPSGNNAPIVQVAAPLDDAIFNQGDAIAFTGSAADIQQGDLSSSIEWISDIDGSLGTGAVLNVNDLSIGSHSISARVTDSGGLIGSTGLTVGVIALGGTRTQEYRATASDDDAEELADGTVKLTSYDLEMFDYAAGSPHRAVGLRFDGLAIPAGAQISNAWIQFWAQQDSTVATAITIEGHKVTDAPVFGATLNNITSRPRTTVSIPWAPPAWNWPDGGPAQQTPDISAILQELVDQGGWVQGNAVALILTGYGERISDSVDNPTGKWPLLHVEFTLVPAPPALIPIDVLPGDSANVVYPNQTGKLPVAVLSSPDFDAAQVDPESLRFGSAAATIAEAVTVSDIDGQHGIDMVAQFRVQDSGIFCDDTEVTLTGSTLAGDPFSGTDTIDASDCEDGGCHTY